MSALVAKRQHTVVDLVNVSGFPPVFSDEGGKKALFTEILLLSELDWSYHKLACSKVPEPSDPHIAAFQREFIHFICKSGSGGELCVAARSMLKMGSQDDMRREYCAFLQFSYRGPADLKVSAPRSKSNVLRSHFKFEHASVQPLAPITERDQEIRVTLENMIEREDSGEFDHYHELSYISFSILKIPIGDNVKRIRCCSLQTFVPRVHVLFSDRKLSTNPFGELPFDPQWPTNLKKWFTEEIREGENSRERYARLIGEEAGVSQIRTKELLAAFVRGDLVDMLEMQR